MVIQQHSVSVTGSVLEAFKIKETDFQRLGKIQLRNYREKGEDVAA